MNTKILVPKKIKCGFQNRSDTYTKFLAYVIYYDDKGILRKETSWEGWRDKKIEPIEYDNIPTSGFVLNKKAGDYSGDWGHHRQAYTRVFDPRGFEFEITIENLLYILENTSSIKGKGLEGDFVYGWFGKDLILVPTCSPDYSKISEFSDMLNAPETIKSSDLVLGGTYRTKQGEDWIYLGRFEKYEDSSWDKKYGEPLGKYYYFAHGNYVANTIKSLSGKIVKTVSTEPVSNYAELMDDLSCYEMYCPLSEETKYVPYTLGEINSFSGWRNRVYVFHNQKYYVLALSKNGENGYVFDFEYWNRIDDYPSDLLSKAMVDKKYNYSYSYYSSKSACFSAQELIDIFNVSKFNKILKNGKISNRSY
jgi:hypothetical protein